MKLVADRIRVNGSFNMRIRALDDHEEQLPFIDNVRDLTSLRTRERLAAGLVRELDCSEESARAAVKQLLLSVDKEAANVPEAADIRLPEICVVGRQLRDIVGDAWAVLQTANKVEGTRFVHRGGLLCEVIASEDLNAARPRTLRVAGLRGVLGARADFVDFKGPALPLRPMLEDLLEAADPPLPELRGVIAAPLLLPSGEVVLQPGFHTGSRYFVTRGPELPHIPDRPTQGDVQLARELLDELLCDFPFVSQADRTHAIAAMLTRVARTLIDGPTPLFDIEAPTEGSGKGLLAEIIALVTTGRVARMLTEGRDEDEWRKRITANLMEGAPITLLDNVRRPIDSAQISAVLTTREWSDRLLGSTRTVTLVVETVWMMTANNPAFSGEVARRVVRLRLDSGSERPWLREGFRQPNLRHWALGNRAALVHALLVLVRAWQAAGQPKPRIVLGSFEAWTSVVGGILSVAGYDDFLGNREEVYEEAGRQLDEWKAVLAAWWVQWQSKPASVSQLHALAVERELLPSLRAGVSHHSAVTKMGQNLAAMRDRVIGDWRLLDAGLDPGDRRRTYTLEPVAGREKAFEGLRSPSDGEDLEGLRRPFAGTDRPEETYQIDERIGAEFDAEAAAMAELAME
ncbi:MAG: hypothetical protein ACYDA0_13365 [Candidatus Dormibacteraceae bacterium]